jgi:SNF2 family DNA or RNA helicase
LELIYFYRLVCDEFHEMEVKASKGSRGIARSFLKKLRARFYLGVTGTPSCSDPEDVSRMAEYLRTELPEDYFAAREFLRSRVRRNEPNLMLPPLRQRIIWVEMSAAERALYQTISGSQDTLMACNHYHLAQEVLEMAGDQTDLSLEEVAAKVQQSRLTAIENSEESVEHCQAAIRNCQHKMETELTEDEFTRLQKRIESLGNEIIMLKRRIAETRAQYNFFEAVVQAMQNLDEQTCLICMDALVEGMKIAIPECGHVYCVDCLRQIARQQARCGMCRAHISTEKVSILTLIRPEVKKVSEIKEKQEQPEIDCSKYGSKLAKFVEFMNSTLANEPNAKFIMFIQFRRLTLLVAKALKEFNIEHVVCQGNVMQRAKAVREFKNSNTVRLILLSSEDSASGLHLVEATHVIIMHPFSIGTDETAMAFEKQGIARAWRSGQEREVQVVRFLVKDSIEERFAKQRNYKEGDISEGF